MRKSGHKKAVFGYIWARIFKNYCHIYYQHPQICLIATFFQKKTQIWSKNALLRYLFAEILKSYCHI